MANLLFLPSRTVGDKNSSLQHTSPRDSQRRGVYYQEQGSRVGLALGGAYKQYERSGGICRIRGRGIRISSYVAPNDPKPPTLGALHSHFTLEPRNCVPESWRNMWILAARSHYTPDARFEFEALRGQRVEASEQTRQTGPQQIGIPTSGVQEGTSVCVSCTI